MDFQLKALGHWSHLYSLSSVWITMCCSRLGRRDRLKAGTEAGLRPREVIGMVTENQLWGLGGFQSL